MVVPTDWKEVRLGDICEFVKTIALSRSQLEADNGVGCIHYGDIHTKFNDRLDCSNVRLPIAESGMVVGVPRLKVGDLVIADASEDMAGVGKGIEILGIPEYGVVAGLHTAVLRPQVGHFARGFLGQLQHMPKFREQARVLASGLKVYGLSKTSISKISVEIPLLKEQEAIAEVLSDADAAVESLDALIAKKRDVKQATMQQLLTSRTRLPGFTADWKEVRLGDICELSLAASKKSRSDGRGKYIIADMGSVSKDGSFLTHKTTDVREDVLRTGDLVMPKDDIGGGQIIGKAVLVDEDERYVLGDHVYRLRLSDGCPAFVRYGINSYKVNIQLRSKVVGSAQLGLGRRAVLEQPISFPPLKEQEAIAEALTVMDDELEALTEQVLKLRMVKVGMMQDLLTGKVRLV